MGRFDAAKLCFFLSRRSLGYNLRNNVTPSLGTTRFIQASTTSPPDHYSILGVNKTATSSEIKKAYFELAKKFHPDINEDNASTVKKFQEIQQAYEALKNDITDQEQSPHPDSPGGFDVVQYQNGFASEFFEFDNTKEILRRKGLRGEDVKVSVELSLIEAIHGCSKSVTFETAVPCEGCGGTGLPSGTRPVGCKPCRGTGMVIWHWQEGEFELRHSCTHCWGCGYGNYCKCCRGDGVVRGLKTVEVCVKPGTEDGEILTLQENGGADPKENRPGDLHVTVEVILDSNVVGVS